MDSGEAGARAGRMETGGRYHPTKALKKGPFMDVRQITLDGYPDMLR